MGPPDMERRLPLVIIGGGLAGNAAAAALGNAGRDVLLLERDTFPRDKICGEFLSGESRRLLREMGCLDEIMKHNPPEINRVRFVSTQGRELFITLPHAALGISRRVLDETLFRHAGACGAVTHEGCEVTRLAERPGEAPLVHLKPDIAAAAGLPEIISGRLVVGAYGRRTKLDRDLDRTFLQRLDSSVGIKLHHRAAAGEAGQRALGELSDTTEIFGVDGGYCGVARIENDLVNVCMLLSGKAFARLRTTDWIQVQEFLSAENPALGRRLQSLVPTSDSPIAVAQMPFAKLEPTGDNILYTGDAAAMIAPLCGDGMAMALESGLMLARMINDVVPVGDDMADDPSITELRTRWDREWRSKFSRRITVGRHLQSVMFSGRIADALMMGMQALPARVPDYLGKVTRSA